MSERLTHELLGLLGEEAFVKLAQAFGGTRLYVPIAIGEDHEIARAIGTTAAAKLSRRLAPASIRVPLAREVRAKHYRAQDMSNARIARLLGITETGIDKLFARVRRADAANDTLPLFERRSESKG